jgi:hypothetical protein
MAEEESDCSIYCYPCKCDFEAMTVALWVNPSSLLIPSAIALAALILRAKARHVATIWFAGGAMSFLFFSDFYRTALNGEMASKSWSVCHPSNDLIAFCEPGIIYNWAFLMPLTTLILPLFLLYWTRKGRV